MICPLLFSSCYTVYLSICLFMFWQCYVWFLVRFYVVSESPFCPCHFIHVLMEFCCVRAGELVNALVHKFESKIGWTGFKSWSDYIWVTKIHYFFLLYFFLELRISVVFSTRSLYENLAVWSSWYTWDWLLDPISRNWGLISWVFFCDRWLKFPPPRPASTVMLSATLLELIFLLARNSKILCPLLTIVMYVVILFVVLSQFDDFFFSLTS